MPTQQAKTLTNQHNRLLQLSTPLGTDVLIPIKLQGSEAMSAVFHYQLTAFSETRHAIDAHELVGTAVTFSLAQEESTHETDGMRYFNGYVSSLTTGGRSANGDRTYYELTVVPWLWFLGKQTDCRVFQNKTVIEVFKTIFDSLGDIAKTNFDGITGNHPAHRYLVQFNETNLSFLNRWLRREGIAYYVVHEHSSHTVHFIDNGRIVPTLNPGELLLHPGAPAQDHLKEWSGCAGFVTGNYAQASYNYNTPDAAITASKLAPEAIRNIPNVGRTASYQYTGNYETSASGLEDTARQMSLGLERQCTVTGTGLYRFLKPGYCFSARHVGTGNWENNGKPFTLTRTTLVVDQTLAPGHHVEFEAVPKGDLVYPAGDWPTISSLQTAVITGPTGSEGTVYTDHSDDRLGRVKVQLHWDRNGKHDQNSSCWLRVMQTSASPDTSAFYALPRVGDEVIVAFENGNPDRPFILGALPTPLRQPPFAATPTRSGIKTQSFDANGPAPGKWNELRFDDKNGHEEIYLRAEKDLQVHTRHDETRQVDNNLVVQITQDEVHRVGGNRTLEVNQNAACDIGNSLTLKAGDSITIRVGGSSMTITDSGIHIEAATVEVNGRKVKLH